MSKIPQTLAKGFIEVKETRTRLDCTRSKELQNQENVAKVMHRG